MNQILFTQDNKQKPEKADIKKIIKIFCIFLIIFAVILIIAGGLVVYKKLAIRPKETDQEVENNLPAPTIQEEPDEPVEEVDLTKPNVQLTISGNSVKIKATDETEIDYITYKWNDDEETKVYALQDDKTTIQQTVEILRGENTFTVLAVDKAGNQYQTIKKYEGILKPEIDFIRNGDNINTITIKVYAEDGIDYVYYIMNAGTEYEQEFRLRTPTTQTEIVYNQALNENVKDNYIQVEAYSITGGKATKQGHATLY